jgi:hypothetical protein
MIDEKLISRKGAKVSQSALNDLIAIFAPLPIFA